MSLFFNKLSRLVIAFLPRSERLIIPWLESPFVVILEPPKIKSAYVSTVSPSICHEVMGPDVMILVFWMLSFKPTFSCSSFTFNKRLFQFSSVTQLGPTLCDLMNCSTPGLPVHQQPLESTQTHVHWVGDAIQPSHPLSSPSPAFDLSRHQGLFQWVSSLHQVAKVLELQLQHQSFQWIFRTDFL